MQEVMKGFQRRGLRFVQLIKWIPKTAGISTDFGKDDIAHVLLETQHPEVYKRQNVLPQRLSQY